MHGHCPVCDDHRQNLFDHCRRQHLDAPFKSSDFRDKAVVACTRCGAPFKNSPSGHASHDAGCVPSLRYINRREEGESLKDICASIAIARASTTPTRKPSAGKFKPRRNPSAGSPATPPALVPRLSASPLAAAQRKARDEQIAFARATSDHPGRANVFRTASTPSLSQRSLESLLPPRLTAATPSTPPSRARQPTATPIRQIDPPDSAATPPASTPPARTPVRLSGTNSQSAIDAAVDEAEASLLFQKLVEMAGVLKHLHPGLVPHFIECVGKSAAAFTADPTPRNLYNIFAIPKQAIAPALRFGHRAVVARLSAWPEVQPALPRERGPRPPKPSKYARAKQLVECGMVGKAQSALEDETAVAPVDQDTIDALRAKHPQGEADPFAGLSGDSAAPPILPDSEAILAAIRKMNPETAPGPSGWSVKLLVLAFGSADFAHFFQQLVADMATAKAIGRDMLCSARLTPLLKPDGGIRPIAVGEIFYRAGLKSIFEANFDANTLSDLQFGVGTPGGTEPLIRAAQLACDGHPALRRFSHLVSLDFFNAFNEGSRRILAGAAKKYIPRLLRLARWCYDGRTPLFVQGEGDLEVIWSSAGVRQGDPMGPYFFSIMIRDLVEELQAELGEEYLVVAYLDDIYIFAPADDALAKARAFFDRHADSPLRLNHAKCKSTSFAEAATSGFKMLGSCIGNRDARAAFLRSKIDSFINTSLRAYPYMPRQHALLLLRRSAQHKLRHLLRSLPNDLDDEWQRLDDALYDTVGMLRGAMPGPEHQARDRLLIALPPVFGGVGVTCHVDTAAHAYAAASANADRLLAPLIPGLSGDGERLSQHELCQVMHAEQQRHLIPTLSKTDQFLLAENASPLGRKWLNAIPSTATHALNNNDIQANLHYRTLYPTRPLCRLCNTSSYRGHAEVCRGRNRFSVGRHETIKHALAGGLRSVPNTAVKEEPYIRGSTRRNDIEVRHIGDLVRHIPVEQYDLAAIVITAPSHTKDYAIRHRPDDDRPLTNVLAAAERILASKARRKVRNLPEADGVELVRGAPGNDDDPFIPMVMSSGGLIHGDMRQKMREWKGWGMSGPAWGWMTMSMAIKIAMARGRTFRMGE